MLNKYRKVSIRVGDIVKYGFLLCLCLLLALPAAAQMIEPGGELISYGAVVDGTVTQEMIFEWWSIQGSEGDLMVVEMIGENGLAPLIGLLDPDGELIARSADGEINGLISMEFTLPVTGMYTIVATRVGNVDGTTTGDYTLRVSRANPTIGRDRPYQPVTFRCRDMEVITAATLEFSEDLDTVQFYRINIFGMDDFQPVIHVELEGIGLTDCSSDSQAMGGTSFTLPGEETVVIEGDLLQQVAQLTITGANQAGRVTLTIGSRDGSAGRYLAVIEGFSIEPRTDVDYLTIGQGPLAARAPLLVYMVAGVNQRLDPTVLLVQPTEDSDGIVCDDAGRRGCEHVPSIAGLHVNLNDAEISGSRFDAGALLPPGDPELRLLELRSFRGNTAGTYALVLLGELPPRP